MISSLIKVFFLVAFILLTVTVLLIVRGSGKMKNCSECIGIITGIYENTSPARVGEYEHKAVSPIVSYTVHGKTYEFIGNYYSTNMTIGSNVRVLYDPIHPEKATIRAGIYLAPIITGGLTLIFTILAIGFYCAVKQNIINF